MALQTTKFTVAERMKDLEDKADYFRTLVKTAEATDAEEPIKVFDEEWNRERNILSVAFIGQYNAGKSTIISALTERYDITIDADIATNKTTEYDWKGIKLIDTPGLWTERKEHDQITEDALRQADLLIFTLTYMLFDKATVDHFKELAFKEGYQNKILLLINKINDEAGDADNRIEAYGDSIDIALKPHDARTFTQCYIDARDYLDGIDEGDQELIDESRFNAFIEALNLFVERQGKMGQLETPVHILKAHIDLALQRLKHAKGEIAVYPEILNRITRQVNNSRRQLRSQVHVIIAELVASIARQGSQMAADVGTEDANVSEAESNKAIAEAREHATKEISQAIEEAMSDLQGEVKEICTSDLTNAYFFSDFTHEEVSSPNLSDTEVATLHRQWQSLSKIAEGVGVELAKLAQGPNAVGKGGLLAAGQVRGAPLQKIVLSAGKAFGMKFKPWQAVNVAKNIGNAAKFVGPANQVISVLFDIWQIQKEEEQSKLLSEAKLKVMAQFNEIGQKLKSEFEDQLQEVEKQTFDQISDEVENEQNAYQKANAINDDTSKALLELRDELNAFLKADRKAIILD
ncbi:MAG: GTPase [Gemmatimonadetes bacterium]|nr:GTPase [Gemmatimonadota bacterium]